MVAVDEPCPGAGDVRLAKYLAHAGVASRRAAEQLIAAGRVTRRRRARHDPARDVDERSAVALDGRALGGPEPRVVYARQQAGRRGLDGARHARPPDRRRARAGASGLRLYPVGRLDADSSGLILLTNDGELANRLTHPRYEVPKTYRVRVARRAGREQRAARACARGVELEDGPTAPARVRRLPARTSSSSRSTRAATARCGACARRSGIRCWSCARIGVRAAAARRRSRPGAHRRLRRRRGRSACGRSPL